MRFYILTLLIAMLCACAFAISPQKPIIVTFPTDTPQSFIDEAMETLKQAGGVVTHEYKLFKGFAAKASESTIEAVKALGSEFIPIIEDDAVVSINGKVTDGKAS